MAGKNKNKSAPKARNQNAQALHSSIFRKQVMPNKKKDNEDDWPSCVCGGACNCEYWDYEEDLDDG